MVRIRAQGEEECKLAHQVFMWLTYARRQLSVAEVQHAVALLPDMTEIDPEAIVDVEEEYVVYDSNLELDAGWIKSKE